MKVLLILAERERETKLFLLSRVSLKYIVSYCVCKLIFDSNLSQIPSNLTSLTYLVTLRLFKLFCFKIRESKQQKVIKLALLCNCFLDLLPRLNFRVNFVLERFLERHRKFYPKWLLLTNLVVPKIINQTKTLQEISFMIYWEFSML